MPSLQVLSMDLGHGLTWNLETFLKSADMRLWLFLLHLAVRESMYLLPSHWVSELSVAGGHVVCACTSRVGTTTLALNGIAWMIGTITPGIRQTSNITVQNKVILWLWVCQGLRQVGVSGIVPEVVPGMLPGGCARGCVRWVCQGWCQVGVPEVMPGGCVRGVPGGCARGCARWVCQGWCQVGVPEVVLGGCVRGGARLLHEHVCMLGNVIPLARLISPISCHYTFTAWLTGSRTSSW